MDGPIRKRGDFLMRKLAELIETELKKQDICAVYNSQIARVWPRSMSLGKRKQQIKRFAKQHKLAVTFYDVGLCAIFERPPQANAHKVVLPLKPKPIVHTRGKKPS
jgi:hypothetical protein